MTKCIHNWDFTGEPNEEVLVCLKCRAKLDATDLINRLNMLERYPANERALYAEKQAELAERNALVEKLRIALQIILDSVDYSVGACRLNEMVGAVLPREVIDIAREAIKAESVGGVE